MALIEKAMGTATVVRPTIPRETKPASPAPRPTRTRDEDRKAPARPAVSPQALPTVLANRDKEQILLGSIRASAKPPVSAVQTFGPGAGPLKSPLQLLNTTGNVGSAGNAGPGGKSTGGDSPTKTLPGAALSSLVENAAGTDAKLLGAGYRANTTPQLVNVEGVNIPVYGARTPQELAQITTTLENTKGIGPEALAAVDQINLYDKGRFKNENGDEIPAFYTEEQIYVNREAQFPNLNHEFGHLVDGLVNGQSYGSFGKGPFLNGDDYNGAEDFAINFDYLTAGTVEGLRPEVLNDPASQQKLADTQEAWDEFRRLYPNGERVQTGTVERITDAGASVVRGVADAASDLLPF